MDNKNGGRAVVDKEGLFDIIKKAGKKVVIKVQDKKVVRVVIRKQTITNEFNDIKLMEIINASPYQIITLEECDNGDYALDIEESIEIERRR